MVHPPGPKGPPILGQYSAFRKDPPAFLLRTARQYGEISYFRIGPQAVFQFASPDLIRGFCPRCGTSIFTKRLSNSRLAVTSGSLDDPSIFKPDMHFWVSSKQPWVVFGDGLPQLPEAAP